jgi:hypothetical protein
MRAALKVEFARLLSSNLAFVELAYLLSPFCAQCEPSGLILRARRPASVQGTAKERFGSDYSHSRPVGPLHPRVVAQVPPQPIRAKARD